MFLTTDLASAKYIGRVGALAIALGIGGMVAVTPAVAAADDSSPESASESSESSPSESSSSGAKATAPTGDRTAPAGRAPRVRNDMTAPTRRAADRSSRPQVDASLPEVRLRPADTAFTAPTLPDIPAPTTPAPTTPVALARTVAPVALARTTAAVTGFLASATSAPLDGGTDIPAAPLDFVTAALSLVSREINRYTRVTPPAASRVAAAAAIPGSAAVATPGSASVTYNVVDNWGSGFTGTVNLTAGPSALNGWTVSFTTPAQVVNLWNGVISSRVGDTYVVTNADWNGQVGAGQSTSFGFQGATGAAGSAVTNLQLNGVAVGGTPVATPPKVSIADLAVTEGNGEHAHFMFTATLDKASVAPVSVNYATANGTATGGVDYTAEAGTITFAAGVTTQTVHVGILGDTVVEPNETFSVVLSAPTGVTIARGTATGTITNDDVAAVITAPTVSIADATVTERASGSVNLAFTATLSQVSATTVTVRYATSNGTATAGADYTAGSGTITFAPGVLSQTVNVAVAADAVAEPSETLTVTLSTPSGATLARATATGTIIDTPPVVSSASAAYKVVNNWGSGFTGTVDLTAGPSALNGWTVSFTTPAEIINVWNGVIASRVGNTYVVTNAAWNGQVGAGQSTSFGFQGATGAAGSAVTNLQINGVAVGGTPVVTAPGVSVAGVTAAEPSATGTAQAAFTVTLSKASTTPVTLGYATANGTATAGTDYTATTGTLTFAPGVTAQQISVPILRDATVEPSETFTVTLTNPTGATITTATATGTITDTSISGPVTPTPGLTPGLSISDASATEPGSGGMAAGFLSTAGNQIIDSEGKTVQISGVNWFGMESTTQAPHGLWTRSYKEMINEMAGLGFNTIRLPYSSELLHTTAAPNGIDFSKNPDLQGLSGVQIMDAIIAYAGQQGLRVILDHHRSGAGAGTSENGLWYDNTYTEDAWVADWVTLANRYKTNSTVIGFDLHNEPHNGTWGGGGATDWARAAERAGNAALAVNPDLLMFVEGVGSYQGQNYWWGGNLMGVKDRPIVFNVANQLVYSPHDYPNSVFPQTWFQTADFGAGLPAVFRKAWGFIYEENIAPIYIGEFGTKLSDPKDAIWLEAITSYISGDLDNNGTSDIPAGNQDISWTYWSWNPNSGDTGGILADDWRTVNQNKMAYLTPIQFSAAGGSSVAAFTVSLSSASASAVTVGYATSNGTATAGSDYIASTGTLTFAPGETSKTIAIIVNGDTTAEAKETFTVSLSNPSGARLIDASGAGSITDQTLTPTPPVTPVTPVTPVVLPKVSIADLAVKEANGTHAHFMFNATLDKASATTVSVGYATANGTATAGVDYTAATGTISFAPGVTTQQVHVDILGDTTVEPDETFSVTLSNPSGVSIARATAIGSILNDDLAGGTPPTTGTNYIDLMTYGMFNGNDHHGMDALVGGRTAITTEAVVAYNDLRRFTGLAPTTIEDVGRWAFANGLTNNAQPGGNDLKGVGLFYAMQGAKVGWIADAKYDPQIVADIERTARLGSAQEVMTMVAAYGHAGYAQYLIDNGYQTAFINTLKMETHWAGWMHDRAHGTLPIEGATAHDVNHLTVLSHDQMRPFMNDTWDYPQWPALNVSDKRVIEYFQSMVTLGNPLGDNSISASRTITGRVLL